MCVIASGALGTHSGVDEDAEKRRRVIWQVPPGARVRVAQGEASSLSIPLWCDWGLIARWSAREATLFEASDEVIDDLSAALAGLPRCDVVAPNQPAPGNLSEHQHAMMAVAAAAHAIDGFYGTIKPLLSLPITTGRPARARRILEALKVGFAIGRLHQRWSGELDWLFKARDDGVHHAEVLRPMVVGRVTRQTMVISGLEAYNFSAASARRAADLSAEIILGCIDRPKPATRAWAKDRSDAAQRLRDG
jgi:hypothetical protein